MITYFYYWVATENKAKVRHLLDIAEAGEKLKIFKADLLEEGSFYAAIDGCDGVFHVASPVDFAPKDPEVSYFAATAWRSRICIYVLTSLIFSDMKLLLRRTM